MMTAKTIGLVAAPVAIAAQLEHAFRTMMMMMTTMTTMTTVVAVLPAVVGTIAVAKIAVAKRRLLSTKIFPPGRTPSGLSP